MEPVRIDAPGSRFPPRLALDGLGDEELLLLLADNGTEFNTKVDAVRALACRDPVEGLIPLSAAWEPLPCLRHAVGPWTGRSGWPGWGRTYWPPPRT